MQLRHLVHALSELLLSPNTEGEVARATLRALHSILQSLEQFGEDFAWEGGDEWLDIDAWRHAIRPKGPDVARSPLTPIPAHILGDELKLSQWILFPPRVPEATSGTERHVYVSLDDHTMGGAASTAPSAQDDLAPITQRAASAATVGASSPLRGSFTAPNESHATSAMQGVWEWLQATSGTLLQATSGALPVKDILQYSRTLASIVVQGGMEPERAAMLAQLQAMQGTFSAAHPDFTTAYSLLMAALEGRRSNPSFYWTLQRLVQRNFVHKLQLWRVANVSRSATYVVYSHFAPRFRMEATSLPREVQHCKQKLKSIRTHMRVKLARQIIASRQAVAELSVQDVHAMLATTAQPVVAVYTLAAEVCAIAPLRGSKLQRTARAREVVDAVRAHELTDNLPVRKAQPTQVAVWIECLLD